MSLEKSNCPTLLQFSEGDLDLPNLRWTLCENSEWLLAESIKAFIAYVEPIFLYNCEIWTITPSQCVKATNAFQRRLLRTYVLNVKWPNIVKK